MSRYWRIRSRNAASEDRSADAWSLGQVGIWYGAWGVGDWRAGLAEVESGNLQAYLDALPGQQQLEPLKKSYVDTARRFFSIHPEDWVISFFDDTLHIAQVSSDVTSSFDHPLNCGGELFKYRTLTNIRSFRLSYIPDVFRLIPSAGRGNVHEFHATNYDLVKMLSEAVTEAELAERLRSMPTSEWLRHLGPAQWESLCLGYLILSKSFLPTGLSVGRTLAGVDIVGVNGATGSRIVAQCKNSPRPISVDDKFAEVVAKAAPGTEATYFAYGGCNACPTGIDVVAADDMLHWLGTPIGANYLRCWRESI